MRAAQSKRVVIVAQLERRICCSARVLGEILIHFVRRNSEIARLSIVMEDFLCQKFIGRRQNGEMVSSRDFEEMRLRVG